VVLEVVPKKVAREESQPVVFLLRTGKMRIVSFMFTAVREVSPEIEQLQRAQNGGRHIHRQEIFKREELKPHVKKDGNQYKLPNREIFPKKFEIPRPKTRRMVVGVVFGGDVAVVVMMGGEELSVVVKSKKARADDTEDSICFWGKRRECAVHCVVGGDEKAREEVRL